jgi:hypothetical protein
MLTIECVICTKNLIYDEKHIASVIGVNYGDIDRLSKSDENYERAGICHCCQDECYYRMKDKRQKFWDNFSDESKRLICENLHMLDGEEKGKLKNFYNICKIDVSESTYYRWVADGRFEQYFQGFEHLFTEEKQELKQDEKSIPAPVVYDLQVANPTPASNPDKRTPIEIAKDLEASDSDVSSIADDILDL